MFAGRYLWWILISIAGFLFFAVYFDYVAWMLVQLSGCTRSAGSCGPLVTFLADTVKPAGYWLTGSIVLACTLARLRYLRFGYGWCLAVAVWSLAGLSFPALFASILGGQIPPAQAFAAIPVALLFLGALVAWLLIPFSEEGGPRDTGWSGFHLAAGVVAAYPTAVALAAGPRLAPVADRLGAPALAAAIGQWQRQLEYLLARAEDGAGLGYGMLAIFVALLLAGLLPDIWRASAFSHLQKIVRGERRPRRSHRV